MSERRTCRERFALAAVDPKALRALADAATHEGATLTVLDDPDFFLRARGGFGGIYASPSYRRYGVSHRYGGHHHGYGHSHGFSHGGFRGGGFGG